MPPLGLAAKASDAATGVKENVFSMFGGGPKKEKKVEEDDEDEPSGSSKKKAAAGDDEVRDTIGLRSLSTRYSPQMTDIFHSRKKRSSRARSSTLSPSST